MTYGWYARKKEWIGPTSLKCRSTNCRHKAQQFIQLRFGLLEDNWKLIVGYCKKHKKTTEYVIQRWSTGCWTFERFMDKMRF